MKDEKESPITFEMDGNRRIVVKMFGQEVGHIFAPSANSHKGFSIQVCGFERAWSLWGCGVYKLPDGRPAQDIQLRYSLSSKMSKDKIQRWHSDDVCLTCFDKIKRVGLKKPLFDEKGTKVTEVQECSCSEVKLYSGEYGE